MPIWLTIGSTEATAPPPPRMTGTLGRSWPTGGGPGSAVAVPPVAAVRARAPAASVLIKVGVARPMHPR